MTKTRPIAGLLAGALALLLAATGPLRADEPPKPDKLVMREWSGPWGEAMVEAAKIFTAQTGIPVLMDYRLDPAMGSLVQLAHSQHRKPPVDLFYTLIAYANENELRGLMEPLPEAEIPNLQAMLPIAKPAHAKDGLWPYVNIGVDIVTLTYRKSKFPAGPPQSLSVMFDPAFKGRILVYPTSEMNLELVALTNGWKVPDDLDRIWGFIETKMKPQDPIIGGDPEAVGAYQRNELDLAFTYPAVVTSTHDPDIAWTKPREGMLGMYESIWVPRGLPESNRYWAMRFINTLLSPEVLIPYCQRLSIPCFRRDMPVPPGSEDDPAFPKNEAELNAIRAVPLDAYAAHHTDWDAHFDELMK